MSGLKSLFNWTSRRQLWFLGALLWFMPARALTELHSQSYLYPVGYHPEQQQFYLLYQAQPNQLKLWSWDPEGQLAFPATLSSYTPANFQFLPDYSGFSFIDHGLIRIKLFNHRIIRTLELYAPLINLNSLQWQSPTIAYFCAQSQGYYGIFRVDITPKIPTVSTVIWANNCDYLYPQLLDQQLFCITRTTNQQAIVRWQLDSESGLIQPASYHLLWQSASPSTYTPPINPELTPLNLKFLHCASATQLYFLAQLAPPLSAKSANPPPRTQLDFACYSLTLTSATAPTPQFLFKFSLPSAYFSAPGVRLYESILPFLPRYTANKIYFCSSPNQAPLMITSGPATPPDRATTNDLTVNLYSYNLADHAIQPLTQAQPGQLYCGGLVLPDGQLYYGGNALDLTVTSGTKLTCELTRQLARTTIPITLDQAWGLPKITLPLIQA